MDNPRSALEAAVRNAKNRVVVQNVTVKQVSITPTDRESPGPKSALNKTNLKEREKSATRKLYSSSLSGSPVGTPRSDISKPSTMRVSYHNNGTSNSSNVSDMNNNSNNSNNTASAVSNQLLFLENTIKVITFPLSLLGFNSKYTSIHSIVV